MESHRPEDAKHGVRALQPVECRFPPNQTFKHFDLKWVECDGLAWLPFTPESGPGISPSATGGCNVETGALAAPPPAAGQPPPSAAAAAASSDAVPAPSPASLGDLVGQGDVESEALAAEQLLPGGDPESSCCGAAAQAAAVAGGGSCTGCGDSSSMSCGRAAQGGASGPSNGAAGTGGGGDADAGCACTKGSEGTAVAEIIVGKRLLC